MKKIIFCLIIGFSLIGCTPNKTKNNIDSSNSPELIINNSSFNVYKVKVDSMEFIVFSAVNSISHERIK